MKTELRSIIGIVIALAVGFVAGLYTGQVHNPPSQVLVFGATQPAVERQATVTNQPAESLEVQVLRARINELRKTFTPEHPSVKSLEQAIRTIEERERAK